MQVPHAVEKCPHQQNINSLKINTLTHPQTPFAANSVLLCKIRVKYNGVQQKATMVYVNARNHNAVDLCISLNTELDIQLKVQGIMFQGV